MTFKEQLIQQGACAPAVEWVGDRDIATAWAECPRGDWMLWLESKSPTPRPVGDLAWRFAMRDPQPRHFFTRR